MRCGSKGYAEKAKIYHAKSLDITGEQEDLGDASYYISSGTLKVDDDTHGSECNEASIECSMSEFTGISETDTENKTEDVEMMSDMESDWEDGRCF